MGYILGLSTSRQRVPTIKQRQYTQGSRLGRYVAIGGSHSESSTWLTRILLEGELIDLIEDFNDGRIQFAFLRVKDTNSKLPKNVLIGWVR